MPKVSLRYFDLPTPTTPGETYALSIGMAYGSSDATIEFWGSDQECGDAAELLWWGPMRGGEICIEFKPTRVHTHLLMVWRALWGKDGADHKTVTFCPTGSCGGQRDGHGAGIDPMPLEPPVGAYPVSAGIKAGPLNFQAKVGFGELQVKGQQSIAIGGSAPIDTGYLRMHASEGFDDAWYCTGAGSTFTWLADGRAHFDFSGITRLADCKNASGGTGTATFTTAAGSNNTVMVSSLAELADPNGRWTANGCFKNAVVAPCHIVYGFSDGRPELRLHAFQAPVTRMQGQDVVQDFTDTALIVMPKDYTSPKIACAGHGTATFAADGSMTISLTEITPFGTCPGQAAVDSTFSGDLEF